MCCNPSEIALFHAPFTVACAGLCLPRGACVVLVTSLAPVSSLAIPPAVLDVLLLRRGTEWVGSCESHSFLLAQVIVAWGLVSVLVYQTNVVKRGGIWAWMNEMQAVRGARPGKSAEARQSVRCCQVLGFRVSRRLSRNAELPPPFRPNILFLPARGSGRPESGTL